MPTRRSFLGQSARFLGGAVLIGPPLLAACGDDDDDAGATTTAGGARHDHGGRDGASREHRRLDA